MPTGLAEKARKERELAQVRRARYEASERGKAVRAARQDNRTTYKNRKTSRAEKLFIVWDGEQPRDTGYSLFGNSEGMEICHPYLSTLECLQLILDAELEYPEAIHVAYGFNFDVSWILKDLPWRALNRLKKYNRCFWNGYQFEHIPHKWFSVKFGHINAKIFDIHSFFGGKLPDALTDWRIGPWASIAKISSGNMVGMDSGLQVVRVVPSLEIVRSMTERQLVELFKQLRSEFLWKDIRQIAVYMRLELKYTKQLIEALREAFLAGGYLPDSWHGPGALATMAMKRHHVYDSMAKCPKEVQSAARSAFFGGRFSPHLCGHIRQKTYFADRNSAYPYACTFLPNLAKGQWRFETSGTAIRQSIREKKFALYRIAYHHRAINWQTGEQDQEFNLRIYPLPKRSENGSIEFLPCVTGWYWTPEAALVINDPDATFIATWIFDEDDENDRPFAWIPEYYRRRLLLKKNGSAAEWTYKLMLNAIFGQCARRTGWDRKRKIPPRSHQLEWAGYITSHCRAAIYEKAIATGWKNVISLDTDGLLSLNPIPCEEGNNLGEWKTDIYDEAIVWQSGMYALRKNGEWSKGKNRGIARVAYTPDDLIAAVEKGEWSLKLRQNKFLGYGMALNGQLNKNNTWIEEPYEFVLGGAGSRYHNEQRCDRICMNTMHRIQLKTFLFMPPLVDPESKPHFLPWMDNSEQMLEQIQRIDDIMLFDTWDTEEWRPDVQTA